MPTILAPYSYDTKGMVRSYHVRPEETNTLHIIGFHAKKLWKNMSDTHWTFFLHGR